MSALRAALMGLLPLIVVRHAAAVTTEVGPGADVEAAMNALAPGDELILQGGTYELSGRFGVTIIGTAALPILVRAKDGEVPHLHRALADQNIVDIDDAQWVTLRGIEFSGGSAGIRISGARALTIEGCDIHDTGDVAIRANDTGVLYDAISILDNHVHHTDGTGEGMYLGCNSNGCQFANGHIEGNYVHHTNGATVVQGDGIEIKEGSYGNVVRRNVIHDTNYPCILTYSTVGNGAPNVIERNLLFGCGDHAIQSAADATIRNNIILGAVADGIAMQPHQAGTPSNLVVVHNTILDADGDAVSVSGATGSVVIANNALFTSAATALRLGGDLTGVVVSGNVVLGGVQGAASGFVTGDLVADFVAASFSGAPPNDVFPKAGGALVGGGDAARVVTEDFNGSPRGGAADVGAYLFSSSGNPGWPLGAEPMPEDTTLPGGGGSGGAGGSGGPPSGGAGATSASGAGGVPSGGGAGPTGGAAGGPVASGGAAGGSPGDAGNDFGGGAGTAGGHAEPSASGGTAASSGGDDGGCGCAVPRSAHESRALLLLLGLSLAACRRLRAAASRAASIPP